MSFNVNWSSLETDSLREWTTELLTGALNSGKRPNVLASDITIKDLNFGKIAPEFEILEIGELAKDRFRGIFKINYSGDFHLTLHTQVQANPLKIYSDSSREMEINKETSFVTPDFLLSTEPFNIPLDLKLSDIKILGIGIIVFSKTKGLTLVFRNDPLDSIKVSSTFDTVKVLSNFLQTQIENQIRDLFREKLPTLIHKFSLKYTSSFKNNDIMNNLRDHLKDQNSQSAFDSLEFETVAPSNLKKLAQLYSSRETLELDIPKIRKTIQRNYLEKFNKDYYPSLANSLYSSLNLPRVQGSLPENNSIPVELLVDSDFNQVDQILKEISIIQTRSNNSNNTDVKRAKRRTIKMSRRMKKASLETKQNIEVPVQVSTNAQTTVLVDNSEKMKEETILVGDNESGDALSDSSTIREDPESIIHHPMPTKAKIPRPFLHRNPEQKGDLFTSANRHVCSSPLSSNSSFVGGVGLGSTVYTIVPGSAICGSPLRTESMNISQKAKTVKVKKSMNSVDIRHINEKLNMMLNFDDSRETFKSKEILLTKQSFEVPPPPYHQISRARF